VTEIIQRYETPRKILLATDLSGRCDRALDRAVLLADEWNASLIVVHAVEPNYQTAVEEVLDVPSWRRASQRRTSIAEQQVREDLLGRNVPFEVVVEDGEPTEIVLKTAVERGCDFIVTGTARNETFGRFILGTTVDRLARRASVPLLVVKARARKPYAKVAVATDFSDTSRHALEGAAELLLRSALAQLHRYRPVAAGLTNNKARDEAGHQLAVDACAEFLAAAALTPERRAKLKIVIERGDIETIVRAYADDKGLDLLVIGARGRNPILDLLLGSTAERLLRSAPCDVLVMRKV
jgi:nucleotide-binding universal stress UspA family protein